MRLSKRFVDRKGFTLVEVMVTLSILSIALLICSQFLLSNMKTYNRADDDIKAQESAQKVVNRLTQDIMESSGITTLLDEDSHEQKDLCPVDVIQVKQLKFSGSNFTYIHDASAMRIAVNDDSSPSKVLFSAENITHFALAPLDNKDFSKTRGIQYEITAKVNNREITLKNKIYYRDEY